VGCGLAASTAHHQQSPVLWAVDVGVDVVGACRRLVTIPATWDSVCLSAHKTLKLTFRGGGLLTSRAERKTVSLCRQLPFDRTPARRFQLATLATIAFRVFALFVAAE
jgi:hypothetical protein